MRLLLIFGFILCLGVADSPAVPLAFVQHTHELPADETEAVVLSRHQSGSRKKQIFISGSQHTDLLSQTQNANASFVIEASSDRYTKDFFILHRNIRI
jgi:hypothetical protein